MHVGEQHPTNDKDLFVIINMRTKQSKVGRYRDKDHDEKHTTQKDHANTTLYNTNNTTTLSTTTNLKLKLGAAEVGPLLLPEVVGLDDEGDVDTGGEGLLQDLQQGLDAVPLGAAHVHDDREAMSRHILAGREDRRVRETNKELEVLSV